MLALLLFGFLVGVRHALEADHVAAVTSLATGTTSLAQRMRIAAVWGSGHALSLIVLGAILIALGTTLSERMARGFEGAAGVMLIWLGVDVLRRVRTRHVHVHVHQHADGARHLHVHAHADAHGHASVDAHVHEHRRLLPRALAVGGVHGLAGTGALVLLSMQTLGSGAPALAYVVVFGLGSILGMVALSVVISLPATFSPRLVERTAGKLEAVVGIVTITLGGWMALQAAAF